MSFGKPKPPPPSRRKTQKDVDNMIKSMQKEIKLPAGLRLGYRHWDEFKYQLYLQDASGRVEIGRPSLGNGNFYDVLLAVKDIMLYQQEKEEKKEKNV